MAFAATTRPTAAVRWIILGAYALFCVVPLVWLLLAPTKTDAQLLGRNPLAFGSLAHIGLAWQHLVAFNGGIIWRWILNSVVYSASAVAISTAAGVTAGYALAVTRFPGRRAVLVVTLVAIVLPPTAVILPLFLEINAVRATNTALSVILPASFFPFGVYLAFVYFATSLPRELMEAARVDGCSETSVFLRIALPLAKPVVALIAFFSFVANWNNYFLPYVMLSDDHTYNLPVGLGAFIGGTPALHPEFGGSFLPITRPEVALAGLVVVAPIVVLFMFCQRFLVRGVLAGSVKS